MERICIRDASDKANQATPLVTGISNTYSFHILFNVFFGPLEAILKSRQDLVTLLYFYTPYPGKLIYSSEPDVCIQIDNLDQSLGQQGVA
jgi:hypothetical protein